MSGKRMRPGVPPRMPKDLRTAWLLLLVGDEPSYGYVLRRALVERGVDVEPGTLYRTLRELEAEGLIESDWREPAGGPRSRVYTITALGERRLDTLATMLDALRAAQGTFLGAYRARRGAAP